MSDVKTQVQISPQISVGYILNVIPHYSSWLGLPIYIYIYIYLDLEKCKIIQWQSIIRGGYVISVQLQSVQFVMGAIFGWIQVVVILILFYQKVVLFPSFCFLCILSHVFLIMMLGIKKMQVKFYYKSLICQQTFTSLCFLLLTSLT